MPHDIFLSYCWNDNTPTDLLDERKQALGWVAHLERKLAALVTMYRGQKTEVWRDASDMRGNFQLSQDVYAALDDTRLLVAVLSESYLRSDWCPDEFDRFRIRARTEGPAASWPRRIFHLYRTPLGAELTTPEIANAKAYEFFSRRSTAAKDHIPFEPGTADFKELYERLVTELASDLAKEISVPTGAAPKGSVYLANPSPDLQLRYRSLRTELKDGEYTVLPDAALPLSGYAAAVDAQIAQSDCGIFLIGSEAMEPIDGADPCEMEFERALEACDPVKRPLLVWIPPLPEVPGRAFAQELVEGKKRRPGLEVRRSEFPQFKKDLRQWLETLREKQAAAKTKLKGFAGALVVSTPTALLYDACDEGHATLEVLEEAARERGDLPFQTPDFTGDPAALRESERQRLSQASVVLIFCGASSRSWLKAKLSALRAHPGVPGRKVGILLVRPSRAAAPRLLRARSFTLLAGAPAALDAAAVRHWLEAVAA